MRRIEGLLLPLLADMVEDVEAVLSSSARTATITAEIS